MGLDVVNGFTGSPLWQWIYPFPPTPQNLVQEGFDEFAEEFLPVLDIFAEEEVNFGLEVHPTEIAFDIHTFERALEAVDHHPRFGINFDPSHLYWQGVDPVELIRTFPDRIFHVHMKDCAVSEDGRSSILASHLQFGDPHRGWDFRSPGRGDIDFEEIIRGLNQIGYRGPLSVEWEDSGMDREQGANEAEDFVRTVDFDAPAQGFEEGFDD